MPVRAGQHKARLRGLIKASSGPAECAVYNGGCIPFVIRHLDNQHTVEAGYRQPRLRPRYVGQPVVGRVGSSRRCSGVVICDPCQYAPGYVVTVLYNWTALILHICHRLLATPRQRGSVVSVRLPQPITVTSAGLVGGLYIKVPYRSQCMYAAVTTYVSSMPHKGHLGCRIK